VCPAALPLNIDERSVVRAFGLDVHRDFCEVAIAADGEIRSAGRIPTRVAALELFAQSLVPGDEVALEATSGTDRIVSVLQRHGVRVVVANTRKLKSITDARAKTDSLDARKLAKLLVSGLLDEVWTPDERTRTLRRLTNRRERIVRARTRAKNEAHGVLGRNLCERPPVTDAFGKAGRRWLAGSSCRSMSASRSMGVCARSTSSTPRSPRLSARSPGSRWPGRKCCG
jgi:transposase